jgi:hypothetical protein
MLVYSERGGFMKTLGGIIMAIGGFITLGAIGNDDYGVMYPAEATCTFSQNLIHAAIGLAVALVGFIIFRLATKNQGSRYR